MCDALSSNGHETTLLAPEFPGSDSYSKRDCQEYYGVKNDFYVARYRPIRADGQRLKYAYEVLRNFLSIALLLRKIRPELVFGRDTYGCHVAATLGYPVICESHKALGESSRLKSMILDRLVRSHNVKQFVTISNPLREMLATGKHPVERARIKVAHDASSVYPLGTLPIGWNTKGERLRVGYIGSFYPGRGIELILEMASRCADVDFHLVGASNDDIARLSKDLCPNVKLVGFVPPSESYKYMNASDILLAPYQRKVAVAGNQGNTSGYMSPLKIFEYMASGKPIVASDLPVLREVLEPELNCLLVAPDDTKAWVNALERLRNSKLRERLGVNARAQFLKRHTWERRAEDVISIGAQSQLNR